MRNFIAGLLFVVTLQLRAQQSVTVPISNSSSAESDHVDPPGWIKVYSAGFTGYIDSEGVEVVPPIYDKIGPFDRLCPGWAEVVEGGLTGMIDREGNLVVVCQYDYIDTIGKFREDWLMVSRNGFHGFIDLSGQEVVPAQYDEIQLPQLPAQEPQSEKLKQ